MHDRPGRQEENRPLAVPVPLPVDPHGVALDVAVGIRAAGPRGVGAPADPVDRFRYGRASKTRLNGVSVARRNRVRPPEVTTSRIRASPAWAPSARPTSWDSDAGVQRSVE